MEILYGVIKVLTITFGACVFVYTLITKIGEEQRKNADYATKCWAKLMNSFPKVMIETFTEVMKIQEQEQAKKYDQFKPKVMYGEEEPEANG